MEPAQTWLSEPDRVLHVALSCFVFFVFIIFLTRVSGKRTTANMNNFDWIITVGIGSIMASGILLRNVAMLDALIAVLVLGLLQWCTTWLASRSRRFARIVKPRPRLLLHAGTRREDAMKSERITADELDAALRGAGLSCRDGAACVVIEANGQLSVISATGNSEDRPDLLKGVVLGVGNRTFGARDDR